MTFYYEGVDKVVDHNAEVLNDGDSMFVKASVTIGSGTDWDGVHADRNSSIEVQGSIISLGGIGLSCGTFANLVSVAAGGGIFGNMQAGVGVYFGANENSLSNAGTISGSTGIHSVDTGNSIVNSGTITGGFGAGIHCSISGDTIRNSGTIQSSSGDGIQVDTSSGGTTIIYNTGTIVGGAIASGQAPVIRIDIDGVLSALLAIQTNATLPGQMAAIRIATGNAIITNAGKLVGDVILGGGNDTFEGGDGLVKGIVAGGGGKDIITTGAGKDIIIGGGGSDTLDGGAGRDTFVYGAASQSGGTDHDTIVGFDARKDGFDLDTSVTGINATVATGALNAATFANDVKAAVGAAKLAAHHAVLFTPTTGNMAGHVILVVDKNGTAGFQIGDKDYVFDLSDADNLGALDRGDFT